MLDDQIDDPIRVKADSLILLQHVSHRLDESIAHGSRLDGLNTLPQS